MKHEIKKDQEKLIVLTSTITSKALPVKLPDLKSRLNEILSFELHVLKGSDLLQAFVTKALNIGIRLDEDVQAYVEKRGPRN